MNNIKILEKIIEKYNMYRFPEAKATLLEVKNNEIKLKFEGFFCRTCGVNDWILDLVYIAKDFGINLKLEKILEPKNLDENYRICIFIIENEIKNDK